MLRLSMDPERGLSPRGNELLIKAREPMISAVHPFNSAGLTFLAECHRHRRDRVDLCADETLMRQQGWRRYCFAEQP